MEDRLGKVRAAVAQLGPTDHVCTLYDTREEEVAIAVSYTRAGLERGEQCVCVVDDGGASILAALASEGVDVDAAMGDDRLRILEKPLGQGLEPHDMLEWIDQHGGAARAAGHTGFRIVGEMSWALGHPDPKALAKFEAQVNDVLARHACVGLCQYDRQRFPPEMLREMILVHPLVVVGDRVARNAYHVPPERYLAPDWPQYEADWIITNLENLLQAQDAVRASEDRYRALSRHLLELQEQERGSLARELHDQLGQSLVRVSQTLDALKDDVSPDARARVPETMQIIDQMLDQVRTLAFELRPAALDDLGLVAALTVLVARQGEHASFTTTPPDLHAGFRIVQEALTNVARHARARHVEVALAVHDNTLEVVVRDDGVGFDAESSMRSGLGLIGMTERATLVGGQLEIESAPGAGTTLRARFPIG